MKRLVFASKNDAHCRSPLLYQLLRPLLFALPPHTAHALGVISLWPVEWLPPVRALVRALCKQPGAGVDLMGLHFPSPVGLAGGFDKNATRGRALAALGFGFVELGTVTAEAQAANPAPNMFRLPADRALVNRLGFPNEGAAAVCARIEARGGSKALGVPLAVSIGKSRSVDIEDREGVLLDYVKSFRHAHRVADFVVVNVSSPNTKNLRALQGAEAAKVLLALLMEENEPRKPLLLKIAPDLDDDALQALLAVVKESGIDGVIATNTTIARKGLQTPEARITEIGAGGLSGPPLRARALEVVKKARAALGPDKVVIGVGGINDASHARALMDAGANLVQLYTGFIYEGPGLPSRLAKDLARKSV